MQAIHHHYTGSSWVTLAGYSTDIACTGIGLCLLCTLQLVTDDHGPHLQPDEVRTFVDKVMELEPSNLTDQGLSCFDSLTCCMESRDKQKLKLASIYLLKVICAGKESVARKAITSVIPKLRTKLGGHEVRRAEGWVLTEW